MSSFMRFALTELGRCRNMIASANMSSISTLVPGAKWSIMRPKVRVYFPRPSEVKRIRVHGWNTRMSTPEGRRVLMRRILKGRHALSH